MKVLKATSPIKKLEQLLLKAKDSYYNSDQFYRATAEDVAALPVKIKAGPITDAVFDKLEDALRELQPNSPVLRKIGAAISNKKQMVALPVPMSSLNKVKPGMIQPWLDTHRGPYCESLKVDGASVLLMYKPKQQVNVYTRGDGTKGGDISFLAPHLDIPQTLNGTYIFRGEAVMDDKTFTRYWKGEYKNARNMVSGILNRTDVHPGVKHVSVVIYSQILPAVPQSQGLKNAKRLGFKTVPYKVLTKCTEADLIRDLEKEKTAHQFKADGIVVAQDKAFQPSRTNPDWAVAVKSNDADEAAEARVKSVSWVVRRTGIIYPTVLIEPTEFDGVTVTKAAGKSAQFIVDNKIGPGAMISLARSGDVIPDIRQVLKPGKLEMPKVAFEWNGANLYVKKGHGTESIVRLRIEHFFTTIGVERFRAATIDRFIDAGYDTITKILRMNKTQFLGVPGGSKVLEQVWEQLAEKRKDIPLPTLMDATGVFGRGLGTRRCSAIVKAIPKVLAYADKPQQLHAKIMRLSGFEQTTTSQFVEHFETFARWLNSVSGKYLTYQIPKTTKGSLTGQSIIMTGFRDADLEAEIRANGGDIAGSVGRATILLTSDPKSTSEKMRVAREKGISILTPEQFKSKYLKD